MSVFYVGYCTCFTKDQWDRISNQRVSRTNPKCPNVNNEIGSLLSSGILLLASAAPLQLASLWAAAVTGLFRRSAGDVAAKGLQTTDKKLSLYIFSDIITKFRNDTCLHHELGVTFALFFVMDSLRFAAFTFLWYCSLDLSTRREKSSRTPNIVLALFIHCTATKLIKESTFRHIPGK